ncbi:MAG: hypothetical protein ACKOPQ_03900 [Novosphingobium sp.]
MLAISGRDRVHWLAVAGLVAACNGIASHLLAAFADRGVVGAIASTGGVNPIFWFAMFAVLTMAFEPAAGRPLSRADRLVVGTVVMLAMLPVVSTGSLGVLIAGGWLVWTGARGSRDRRVGVVLLALTASLIWGHFALMLLGDRIVSLDGGFVGWLAGTTAQGNLVSFSDGGRPMLIAYGCSSMHNITMALQFWAATTQLLRIPFGLRSLLVALAAVVANVFVNGLRLATLAHNQAEFDYWHVGGGGALFAWLAVAAVVVTVMVGFHASAPRRV